MQETKKQTNTGLDFHRTSTQTRRELNICAHLQLIVSSSLSGLKNVFTLYIQPWLRPEYLSAFPDSFREKKPTGTVVSVMPLTCEKTEMNRASHSGRVAE